MQKCEELIESCTSLQIQAISRYFKLPQKFQTPKHIIPLNLTFLSVLSSVTNFLSTIHYNESHAKSISKVFPLAEVRREALLDEIK